MRLCLLLAALALLAVAGPAWIVRHAPRIVPHRRLAVPQARVVPPAELPPVEPLRLADLTPDDARAFNATVPFSNDPNPPARPFMLAGGDEDKARAIDCMATAVLYEAGDDTLGQRAVAQVVINRARHPAFPKTICGVVFQGSERTTGCQFTFTCDGALLRHRWPDAAWARARDTARRALNGTVYKPVGYATHYHTDWVVPYWQSSLDKVVAVDTHLFFRWTGWWGTPSAFDRHVSPEEPVIAQLAVYSAAHRVGALALDQAGLDQAAIANGGQPQQLLADSYLVTLDPRLADRFAALAGQTCGARIYCKYMGWTAKAKTPTALPLSPSQIAAMSFSYLRDRASGYDKALWNCAQFRRSDPSQCMKLQVFMPVARDADLAGAPADPDLAAPVKPAAEPLTGVRRRPDLPGPTPTPTPTPSGK